MIERDKIGIVHYDNPRLGITHCEYPRDFIFFAEGEEREFVFRGKRAWHVGANRGYTLQDPAHTHISYELIVIEGEDCVHAVHKSRLEE